ncbi:MAG: hypothetical protein ACTSVT_02735 [Candidatus Thorarchaeota archaeon]
MTADFTLVLGLWTFALVVVCAVADKLPGVLTFLGVLATMGFVLGYAWWFSHVMVDNQRWSAGAVAFFFLNVGNLLSPDCNRYRTHPHCWGRPHTEILGIHLEDIS